MLLDAWLGWRGDRLLPRRSEVDPIALKPILPLLGILEIAAKDIARFRLAGTGLRDVFGFDPSGKNAVELVRDQYRVQRAYRLYLPATMPCAYLGQNKFAYASGVPDTFESVGLPLDPDKTDGHRLIIFALDSLRGKRWRNDSGSIIDMTTDAFQFVDIGAGIPPSTIAPADFMAG